MQHIPTKHITTAAEDKMHRTDGHLPFTPTNHKAGLAYSVPILTTIGVFWTDTMHDIASTIHWGLMTTCDFRNSFWKCCMEPRSCKNWTAWVTCRWHAIHGFDNKVIQHPPVNDCTWYNVNRWASIWRGRENWQGRQFSLLHEIKLKISHNRNYNRKTKNKTKQSENQWSQPCRWSVYGYRHDAQHHCSVSMVESSDILIYWQHRHISLIKIYEIVLYRLPQYRLFPCIIMSNFCGPIWLWKELYFILHKILTILQCFGK